MNSFSLSTIRTDGKQEAGGERAFVGVDFATGLSPLASSSIVTTDGAGSFNETFDLGGTSFDRVAMVVWTEGRDAPTTFDNFAIVPEPGSLGLVALGLLAVVAIRHRRT